MKATMVSVLVITVAPLQWRHNARCTTSEWIVGSGKNTMAHVPDGLLNLTTRQPDLSTVVHGEGVQLLENIANIRVPVIAAIEGRAHAHSEYALLANVIVAAEGATFHDVHCPGDGIFTTWTYRAGPRRAEAFLLTPQPLTAPTAYEWGVPAEVVPNGKALSRARELADLYLKAPEVTRRNTRVHFIQPLKERLVREVGYGLSLEGASAADLVKSMQAKGKPLARKRKIRMKSTGTSPSVHVLKQSQPEEFDLLILGGGTGSTIAAWTFAGEGKRVAVVDRKYIGRSCPNIACLPSKNIIHSAKVVDYFRRSSACIQELTSKIGLRILLYFRTLPRRLAPSSMA
jgi:hypothetical protein